MNRRQRRRVWILSVCFSLVLVPCFGWFWLMLVMARGMSAFGPPRQPDALSATIYFLTRLPLPLDTAGGWIFNGVCWGILLSLLLAAAVVHLGARIGKPCVDPRRGFSIKPREPGQD